MFGNIFPVSVNTKCFNSSLINLPVFDNFISSDNTVKVEIKIFIIANKHQIT